MSDDKARQQVIDRLRGLFDGRQKVLPNWPAILGTSNTTGSASVSDREGWCYARMGSEGNGAQVVVFNNRTAHRNGLAVIIGYASEQANLLQVLAERQVYEDSAAGAGTIAPHHKQHEWGNDKGADDTIYPRLRQVMDCRVEPYSGLTVKVQDGLYRVKSTVYYFAGGTVDLTSYLPSFGYKWVVLTVDEAGVVGVTEGTARINVSLADLPEPADAEDWELAAVRLAHNSSEITDWPSTQMIVDLRFAGGSPQKTFLALSDVDDSSYSSKAGHVAMVNSTESGIELDTLDLADLGDMPSYTGKGGYHLKVNSTESGIEAAQTASTELTDMPSSLTVYKRLRVDSGGSDYEQYTHLRPIAFVIGSGNDVVGTGVVGDVSIPFAGTIIEWHLLADQSGSIVIDVWKDTYANYPPTVADTIAGSEKPTLSSASKNQDTNLTTWTTSIAAGDCLRFNVDSASTVTQVTLVLVIEEK